MAGITLNVSFDFSGFPEPIIDEEIISQWLQERLDDARNHFVQEASGPSQSAPGAYPGLRTGQLVGSVNVEAGGREGTMSSGVEYAGYLTHGTRRMASRKMLADALDESLSARPQTDQLAQAVKWGYA